MPNLNKVIYSINVADLQQVADDLLDRKLTNAEIKAIEECLGDYFDWYGAIENAIREKTNSLTKI
jgi:hypothetical protein